MKLLPFEHCQDCGGQSGEPAPCSILTAAAPAALGAAAAEWHRYLHQEGILVEDEGQECGPWHHRVFLAAPASTSASPEAEGPPGLDIEQLQQDGGQE